MPDDSYPHDGPFGLVDHIGRPLFGDPAEEARRRHLGELVAEKERLVTFLACAIYKIGGEVTIDQATLDLAFEGKIAMSINPDKEAEVIVIRSFAIDPKNGKELVEEDEEDD